MKTLLWTLAVVLSAALADVALAGEPVRILVEPPPGVASVDAGQSIDVQIVGEDAAGVRVGFSGRQVDTSVSDGVLVVVEAPYRWRYTAPENAPPTRTVQLRAWLRQRPDVQGALSLSVASGGGRRPADRLVLRGPSSVTYGGTANIEALAARPDGSTSPVRDRGVATLDGPGVLETTGAGQFRYTAPGRPDWSSPARTARITAALERDPRVTGELAISLVRDGPQGPQSGDPARLSVDLPQGVTTIEPGQTLDLQVSALDSAGNRVALGERRVEASATEGDVTQPDASGRFRYSAPVSLDGGRGSVSVQIRAWLKQRPDVLGVATVSLVPRRPYDRLLVRGPASVEPGEVAEIEVLGVRADGASSRIRDQRMSVALDGPGALESLSPGLYRYTALREEGRWGRRGARITASLERWPNIAGELTIEIERRGGGGRPGVDIARLAFELPQGVTSVEAGQSVELRLTALDASGNRVDFNERRVDATASVGELVPISSPDRWRYTAPANVDRPSTVELRATLQQRGPPVQWTTTLQLTPRRPFERLLVRGATSVEAGRAFDVDVLAVRADGLAVEVRERIVLTLEGPGTLQAVPGGVQRYTAPASTDSRGGLRTGRIVASLERWPTVRGELSFVLTPEPRSQTPYGRLELRGPSVVQLGTTADYTAYFTQRDGSMSPVTDQRVVVALTGLGTVTSTGAGTFRYTAPPAADRRSDGATVRLVASLERTPAASGELAIVLSQDPPSDAEATGVLWPSGNVRLVLWRAKERREDDWPTAPMALPTPGRPLVSPGGFVRLRIQPERDDVRKIELEWAVGDRGGAVIRQDDSDPSGKLRLVRGPTGRTHAVVETELPENGRPLYLTLLLTTARGEVLREEFVVEQRRRR
jgi:hypothetical protein